MRIIYYISFADKTPSTPHLRRGISCQSFLTTKNLNYSRTIQIPHFTVLQRAYLVKCTEPNVEKIVFQISASKDSPVQNLAIVIEGLAMAKAEVVMNNKKPDENTDFTIGKINGLEVDKTVVFLKVQSDEPLDFTISNFKN